MDNNKKMKIIRKVWIYFLLKNTIAVYAGQSLYPDLRIREHKDKKDFDDHIIVDFPLEEGEMANVVEMAVIIEFDLIKNGQNKKLSHMDEYIELKKKYSQEIKDFFNALENKHFVYPENRDEIDYESILSPNYWENEFNEYIENGLSIGLSVDKWYDKIKDKKPYTKKSFYDNTVELRHDYWKNEYEELKASGKTPDEWCVERGYSLLLFSTNTSKFWDFDWEEEFEDFKVCGKNEQEWCALKVYSISIFNDKTYKHRLKYWKNLYKEQQDSGLNPKQWCLENGIPLQTFMINIIDLGFINWKKLKNEQHKSGLNKTQWCLENGYQHTTFNRHTYKFENKYP